MNILGATICVVIALYGVVIFTFYLLQEKFIFSPKITPHAQLEERALSFGYRAWRTDDGAIIGWHRSGQNDSPPVLVLHGTGGDAFGTRHLADVFQGSESFLLEYPGFGSRPGRPSISGQIQAAVDALDSIGKPVFLAGYSMGTGIAAMVASRRSELIRGLLLLAPFDKLSNVAIHRFPFLPSFVIKHNLNSVKSLKNIDVPIALILAGKDKEIPPKFGLQLYDKHQGEKKLWILADSGHKGINIAPPCQTGSAAVRYLMHHGSS